MATSVEQKEDVWISTNCEMCPGGCGILVRRVNGEIVDIRGNPDDQTSLGKICAKSFSSILMLKDPNRVNVPLKRTSTKKGIGIDPGWVEITWDEALDVIVERLKKIRAEDPRKLLYTSDLTVSEARDVVVAFGKAFGSPNYFQGGSGPCGDANHLSLYQRYGCGTIHPDTDFCNYFLNFGCGEGAGSYFVPTGMAQRVAEARVRGMRTVVIDPVFSAAAAKANEWIPIKPGTDGALALSMLNVLLNELQIYDSQHIKRWTNGPYLVETEGGYYVRDKETKKPLVWDAVDTRAKTYDDPMVKDYALEGEYIVNGKNSKPAFFLLREHIKKYTPEQASEITTVAARTIRRIAREFGEAATLGRTIEIGGKVFPFRPVATAYYKGPSTHVNGHATCTAIELLTEVVGARAVPGGVVGNARCMGYPGTGLPFYSPRVGVDGFLENEMSEIPTWPLAKARKPERIGLQDLIPTAAMTSPFHSLTIQDPGRWKIPYNIEFNLSVGVNFIGGKSDPGIDAEAFKNIFQVSFELYLNETSYFSDIVLPDACFLESLSFSIDKYPSPVKKEWSFSLKQRVVEPLFKRRQAAEVLLEIAERTGILKEYYEALNTYHFREPYKLKSTQRYTWEEIIDRRYRSLFGSEHGLEWFKKNGTIKWPRKVEEIYWKLFVGGRTFLYDEYLKEVAYQVGKVIEENKLPQLDLSHFQPLPDWRPCRSHQEERSEYDLFVVWRRDSIASQRWTHQHPWLDEVCRTDPYAYNFTINSGTAKRKGLKNGDWVKLTSATSGNSIKGKVQLTEGIHPEVICIAGGGGHWAKGLPIASQPGKGALFEWLIPLSFNKDIDTVTLGIDWCVRAKVSKAEKVEK